MGLVRTSSTRAGRRSCCATRCGNSKKRTGQTRFSPRPATTCARPVAAANLFVDDAKAHLSQPAQRELIEKLEQSMNVFSGLLEGLLDISRVDSPD